MDMSDDEDLWILGEKAKVDSDGNILFTEEQRNELKKIAEDEELGNSSSSGKLRIGAKSAVKKAIKFFLDNRQKITNLIGKTLGSDKAVKFGNALKRIEEPLRKLMYAENAVMNDVRQVIFDGLRATGLQRRTANEIADFVMKVIELLM